MYNMFIRNFGALNPYILPAHLIVADTFDQKSIDKARKKTQKVRRRKK